VTHESSLWDAGEGLPGAYQRSTAGLSDADRVDPASVTVPAYLPDVPEVRRELARYFECLKVQDREVGQTLAAIDAAGLREETIVIYLTDHGRGIAREKRWPYDAGIHLPLIVRWPEAYRPAGFKPGSVRDDVVSWVDLAPTILSLAGVPIPAHYQGQPFTKGSRQFAISGRDRMDETFDRVRTITDGRYRYVRNDFPHLPYAQRNKYQENSQATQALRRMDAEGSLRYPADVYMQRIKPAEELYDADTDRDMVRNLAGDPAYASIRDRLRAALESELARFGDLGELDETELIARGILTDRLANEYRLRVVPLPAPYHERTGPTYVTRNDAIAAAPSAPSRSV
jgi:arylsulfatase A-like enzyme